MPDGLSMLHLLQQAANALQVSAFYALLAVAYVLLHGVSNRFNLALGAVAVWAGYVTIGLATALLDTTFWSLVAILAAAFAASLGVGAALGAAIGEGIVAPLMRAPSPATLVATLGLAIALEEAMRIATDAGEFWLQPVYAASLVEIGSAAYPVRLSLMQALVLAASVAVAAALGLFMKYSRFGREWRACADDPRMLALLGVDTRRLIVLSSMLSCLVAAFAGFLLAVNYGNVTFTNGFVLGLKALFVAVVGGLGSIRGACLGALAVGFAETAWSAAFPLEYRDVATFVALTAFVVLRAASRRSAEEGP